MSTVLFEKHLFESRDCFEDVGHTYPVRLVFWVATKPTTVKTFNSSSNLEEGQPTPRKVRAGEEFHSFSNTRTFGVLARPCDFMTTRYSSV